MEAALEFVRIIVEYFGLEGYDLEDLFYGGRRARGRRRNLLRGICRELSRNQMFFFTKRSIVREIGSRLPLRPCKRPYFELRDNLSRNESLSQEIMQGKPLSGMLMASLADVAWITEDGSSLSNLNSDGFFDEESFIEDCNPQKETEELASTDQSDLDNIGKEELSNNSEAMQKISALEEELQKLRAQIAMMIVANPQSQVSVGTTLTPAGAPVPPLPPPPPPPPPPTLASTPLKPVSQIIRENKARRLSLAPEMCLNSTETSSGCSLPNMADVLKGLGKVKLRSVERSPGGTPLRKTPLPADGNDPASIIAQALKKKFAHRRRHEVNSPDANKENNSSMSPFGTPPSSPTKQIPFGPHLLKPAIGKRRSSTGLEKTKPPRSPLVEVC
ncbi:mitochondrial fission regulator 1-like isoform X1 [Acropora palmata]|uniref:mitochondrial fission regulator 1-like isoform X1 n=2 Tax=Acropora palmata TaxID=6131 RepID=UPI003DA05BEA